MKETTIQIKTEFEKVNAIRICMNGKGGSFEQELADYVDALYKKYVPQAVREFIEKKILFVSIPTLAPWEFY